MGIAVITAFCNESFRIPKWKEYYTKYKDEAVIHIIVDNNSDDNEYDSMRKEFPNSVIIRLQRNGGVTAAFNAGIKYVLENDAIDAIALIGNDIKLEHGGLTALYNFLMSDDELGEVSPVLLRKDSMIIEDNGDWFDSHLHMCEYDLGKTYATDIINHVADGLPGAMNVAKKKIYQDVGLLNEELFMYSDEVDFGIRAKRKGYKFSSFSKVVAWHQHENPNKKKHRPPFANYLVARNKVYIAGLYFSPLKKAYVFSYFSFLSLALLLSSVLHNDKEKRIKAKWQFIGACKGLINDMKHNKYSNPGGV